jgi:hypothetical protein
MLRVRDGAMHHHVPLHDAMAKALSGQGGGRRLLLRGAITIGLRTATSDGKTIAKVGRRSRKLSLSNAQPGATVRRVFSLSSW